MTGKEGQSLGERGGERVCEVYGCIAVLLTLPDYE